MNAIPACWSDGPEEVGGVSPHRRPPVVRLGSLSPTFPAPAATTHASRLCSRTSHCTCTYARRWRPVVLSRPGSSSPPAIDANPSSNGATCSVPSSCSYVCVHVYVYMSIYTYTHASGRDGSCGYIHAINHWCLISPRLLSVVDDRHPFVDRASGRGGASSTPSRTSVIAGRSGQVSPASLSFLYHNGTTPSGSAVVPRLDFSTSTARPDSTYTRSAGKPRVTSGKHKRANCIAAK